MSGKKYKELNNQINPSDSLIEQTKEKVRDNYQINNGEKNMKNKWKTIAVSAVATLTIFAGGINMSTAFAASLENIPVLGQISRVFLIDSYIEKDKDKTTIVKQPGVYEDSIDINEEISKAITVYKAEAEEIIFEYKNAFIETGGTEEEFAEKNIEVSIDYEVKCETDKLVSFILHMNQNWNASFTSSKFYNLDSATGEKITLADLLGDNYIEICNDSINQQISDEISNSGESSYFSSESGGFESITDEANFYINELGNPVIVFDKYEIAAGVAGTPEFEIPYQ